MGCHLLHCMKVKGESEVTQSCPIFSDSGAYQAPLSMGFSRQEYWSGVPFASPGDLPNPGIKTLSTALASRCFTTESSGKPEICPGIRLKLDFPLGIKCIGARVLCPLDLPGKNTGVDCHFLLQGIFLTQESNPGLLHSRQIL